MPADRLLSTLLRSLQTYTTQQDTPRFLGTAVNLLTTLGNPLNVTLLTSQLLTAPALWTRPDGLRSCLSFMGISHSAVVRITQRDLAAVEDENEKFQVQFETRIPLEEWVRAVIAGADERSPRWRHLLVLGGLLVGIANPEYEDLLPYSLKSTLQAAFVKATNLALTEQTPDELPNHATVLALNHTFPYLSDFERSQIEYDRLLPIIMYAMLHSSEGLRSGYFLTTMDTDVQQSSNQQFNWPASSASFYQIQKINSSPLITSLGPLSRLAAHAAEQVHDPWLISSLVDDLAEFSRTLCTQWRKNKLSEIDPSEETDFLHEEARQRTLPTLWRVLRSTMFSVVIVLRNAVGRILGDGTLAADSLAPSIAQQALHILRDLNFIFARLGSSAFSQYTFAYLTSIDILTCYPSAAHDFLRSIAPKTIGTIPHHPLDRVSDLFFLNAAEHFTMVLVPQANEDLLIATATPYLATGGNRNLLPIFEAAHSVMLAVFAAPQNVEITARHLPIYVDALFKVFPHSLSARQFRLAFCNLARVTSPPSHIAANQPMLAATMLEILRERAIHASTSILPADPVLSAPDVAGRHDQVLENTPQHSEQTVLVSTLIDSFPNLAVNLLEEWLPLTADLINHVQDASMRESCRQHLWDVMVGGGMDPERSQVCVAWWTTRGGREMLLASPSVLVRPDEPVMSGALPDAGTQAKL